LEIKLGRAQAQHVYDLCRGVDDSPVLENTAPQTLTSAKNLQRNPARNLQALDRWISMNATDLWMRVMDEWEARRRWPQSLMVAYTPENRAMRTRTVGFPSRQQQQQQGAGVVADAARACLQRVAGEAGTFPVVGVMLTAKTFRKELAAAGLMERWLAKKKTPDGGKKDEGEEARELDFEDEDDEEYQPQIEPPAAVEVPSLISTFPSEQLQIQAPNSVKVRPADQNAIHGTVPMLASVSGGDDTLLLTPGCASGYDTTDSDLSCLKTPHESESDECGSEDTSGSTRISAAEETFTAGTVSAAGATGDSNAHAAGRHAGEHGPPSRSTTVSSRRRTGVYIQSHADMESAARYGEGYKHMNIDRHDDGSLVVASADESTGDGFIPALIAATRRKREIQIIRFQHAVDAPEGAIAGTSHAAAQHPVGGAQDTEFLDCVRDKLQRQQAENSSSDESTDPVLDMAVSAMMESLSAAQAVMQIRCPQCPEGAALVSSAEWETHCDWHIAREMQERELRHDKVAGQFQRAFVDSTEGGGRREAKKPRREGERAAEGAKRRQKTIGEAWK
ncbi:N-acetyltransferase eso1, partial [Coemansia sp. RSA 2603]